MERNVTLADQYAKFKIYNNTLPSNFLVQLNSI